MVSRKNACRRLCGGALERRAGRGVKSENFEKISRWKERVLVTTNVCARGIDVEQVTLVVNFDLPMTKVCKNS